MESRDKSLICSVKILEEHPEQFPWYIVECPGMGRSCFAARDIAVGETLVRFPQLIPACSSLTVQGI